MPGPINVKWLVQLWISPITNQTSFSRFTVVLTSNNTNNQGGTKFSNTYEPHQNFRCRKNGTKQVLQWVSTNIKAPPYKIWSPRPPDARNWGSLAAAAAAVAAVANDDDDSDDDDIIQTDLFSSKFGTEIFIAALLFIVGRCSSVGIATGYRLDNPGIESRWGRDFPHLSRPVLRPTQPPVQWLNGLSRG